MIAKLSSKMQKILQDKPRGGCEGGSLVDQIAFGVAEINDVCLGEDLKEIESSIRISTEANCVGDELVLGEIELQSEAGTGNRVQHNLDVRKVLQNGDVVFFDALQKIRG